jgi:hypothetical protein
MKCCGNSLIMKKFYVVFTVLLSIVSIHANTINIGCPAAGTGGSITICDTNAISIFLADIIVGENLGGTWIRTSGIGGVFSGLTGTYAVAPGSTTSTFTYTVSGVFPCLDDSSTVTININNQPNAGFDGCLSILDSDPTVIDLQSIITGEAPAGIWTRTSGTGGVFNAVSGTFAPTIGSTSSTLLYTVNGISPCLNDSSIATVIVNGPPPGEAVTIFCDPSGVTTFPVTSIFFDWNNPGGAIFNISYSINGGPIARTSTTISSYEVFDVPPISSVTFTVQPVGSNCFPSSTATCDLLSIDEFESRVVAFSPNPVTDFLNVAFSQPVRSIQISNVLGQQVFSGNYNDKDFQIDLSRLSSGTYIVKAMVTDTIRTFKIVKN